MHRREWLLIGIAFLVVWPAVIAFSVVTGSWWLLGVLAAWTLLAAANAWRQGLPLWPGREPRRRDR